MRPGHTGPHPIAALSWRKRTAISSARISCANYPGGGAHIANTGYMVAQDAGGRGVGRALCQHSMDTAKAQGFRAMQFNFVVSTNASAMHLWQSLGFEIIGHVPGSFRHPTLGDVASVIMFRKL